MTKKYNTLETDNEKFNDESTRLNGRGKFLEKELEDNIKYTVLQITNLQTKYDKVFDFLIKTSIQILHNVEFFINLIKQIRH